MLSGARLRARARAHMSPMRAAVARITNCYMMSVGDDNYDLVCGSVVDATNVGNMTRFINNGCSANCTVDEMVYGPVLVLAILASKNIVRGTEITYSYKFCRGCDTQC